MTTQKYKARYGRETKRKDGYSNTLKNFLVQSVNAKAHFDFFNDWLKQKGFFNIVEPQDNPEHTGRYMVATIVLCDEYYIRPANYYAEKGIFTDPITTFKIEGVVAWSWP